MLSLRKLGFTMIELLIVIAVLGILAVAVLAAINPIEQINRGRDTGSRSDAEQLLSAIDRYYAGKGFYPWSDGASSLNTSTFGSDPDALISLDSADITIGDDDLPLLNNVSSGGSAEVKESFITRITDPGYNHLGIYNNGVTSSSTYVCFLPKSASFREEAWNRCSNDDHTGLDDAIPSDFPAGACPADGTCATAATADAAIACQICLP
jgi:prepilin-type N-terminal cleavage/methylation domain-containing protein